MHCASIPLGVLLEVAKRKVGHHILLKYKLSCFARSVVHVSYHRHVSARSIRNCDCGTLKCLHQSTWHHSHEAHRLLPWTQRITGDSIWWSNLQLAISCAPIQCHEPEVTEIVKKKVGELIGKLPAAKTEVAELWRTEGAEISEVLCRSIYLQRRARKVHEIQDPEERKNNNSKRTSSSLP